MSETDSALDSLHDAYAGDYDRQCEEYGCYIADLVFGLSYQQVVPGQVLLDIGIGTGLSAAPFARAGLQVHGMDFSEDMLAICERKRIAESLIRHDLQVMPWPVEPGQFDWVISVGVFHFIPNLEAIFHQVREALRLGGAFAFTTKLPRAALLPGQRWQQETTGGFEIISHSAAVIESWLGTEKLSIQKAQDVLVGEERFRIWITRAD